MNRFRQAFCLVLLVAGGGAAVPGAAAQSLLSGGGLGLPGQAIDARAQSLGGVLLGFPSPSLSLINPAAIAGLPAPAITATLQPEWTRSDYLGREASTSTARFPLFQIAAPLGERWAVSAGYGAYLDQNFEAQSTDTASFAGSAVQQCDRQSVDGGVARLRLGGAYAPTARFAVGAGVDLFTGSRTATSLRRSVQPDSACSSRSVLPDAVSRADWDYSGVGFAGGVRWQPLDALSLAASASTGATLDVQPAAGDTISLSRSYSLPVSLAVGASGRVASAALVVLSARWDGWSRSDADLAASSGARDAWTLSGGLEWDPPGRGERSFPLRVGARYGQLPFRSAFPAGADFPTERAVTAGVGARLAGGAAMVDLAAERGWRGSGAPGVDERFWRTALSLTLFAR